MLRVIDSPAGTAAGTPLQSPQVISCALLTERQVSEAMNMKVDPGVRQDSRSTGHRRLPRRVLLDLRLKSGLRAIEMRTTRIVLSSGASFAILTVISWPRDGKGAEIFLQSFLRDAAESHVIANTPIPLQIGDEALWWGDGVAVRKNNHSFGISVHLVNERSKERQLEESLAATIAARL